VLTRMHFVAMAAIVNRRLTECKDPTLADRLRAQHTADAFVSLAESFNPRFDRQRFYAACGLEVKRS